MSFRFCLYFVCLPILVTSETGPVAVVNFFRAYLSYILLHDFGHFTIDDPPYYAFFQFLERNEFAESNFSRVYYIYILCHAQ